VRQIFPVRAGGEQPALTSADLAGLYAYPEAGTARPEAGRPEAGRRSARPWLRANMVQSADGSAAVSGLSGGLSSDGDRQLFAILRGLADVILAGAGTVRAEKYAAVRPREIWAGLREGRTPTPPIAVVTAAMDLDLSSRLFTAAPAHARTIVITVESAPADRRRAAARVADVILAGADRVDLKAAVDALADRGHSRILAEGGPHLLGQLAAAGLLDELCLTIAPVLAAGNAGRILAGSTADAPAPLHLAHILEDHGYLLCRYLTDKPPPPRTK